MAMPLLAFIFLLFFFPLHSAGDSSFPSVVDYSILPHALSDNKSLCSQLVLPAGYPCAEHKDGFLLGLQRVSSRDGELEKQKGPPILLLHGLFMAGDGWFLNSARQSLGFILPDNGFDVWIGNVRGTRWSYGHSSLSEDEKEFWNWSWEELALYDLAEMINYINSLTNKKIYIVGHSQGTIMSFAALTQPDIAKKVGAAALLSPISYLEHITAPLMIRKGSFSKYDYGLLKNLRVYGQRVPPEFDLSRIPESLPLWMAYGGNDELSDWTDLENTIKKVKSVPELVYLENYGHVDFILSMKAKEDVYDPMIKFFKSLGKSSSL